MNTLRSSWAVTLAMLVGLGTGCQPSPDAVAPPAATATPAAGATPAGAAAVRITLAPLAGGFTKPLAVTNAGDGTGDLYVVEQAGTVRVIRQGALDPRPFLTITNLVRSTGNEQGLLGLAFHPDFKRNGLLFVNYTDLRGNTVIARYTGGSWLLISTGAQRGFPSAPSPTRTNRSGRLTRSGSLAVSRPVNSAIFSSHTELIHAPIIICAVEFIKASAVVNSFSISP